MFVLNRLSRRLPHVDWLQVLRLPVIQMSDEQKARQRRSGNRMAGLEMVLAGVILPLLYFASTVMMFSGPEPIAASIVAVISVACIAIGIWLFVRNW